MAEPTTLARARHIEPAPVRERPGSASRGWPSSATPMRPLSLWGWASGRSHRAAAGSLYATDRHNRGRPTRPSRRTLARGMTIVDRRNTSTGSRSRSVKDEQTMNNDC